MKLTGWVSKLHNRRGLIPLAALLALPAAAQMPALPASPRSFALLLQQYRQGAGSRYDTNTNYEHAGDGPPLWARNLGLDYATLDMPAARPGFAAAIEHRHLREEPPPMAAIGQPCAPQPVTVNQFLNNDNLLRYRLLRRAQSGDAPPVPQTAMVAFDTGKQWAQAAQSAASAAQAQVDGENAVTAFRNAIRSAPWVGLYYYDAGVAARPIWHDVQPNAILFFDWYLLTADPNAPQAQAARAAIAAIGVEAETRYCQSLDFRNIWNPLAWAVASGDLAGVRLRLAQGAAVNQTWSGLTLLGIAAASGDLAMVRLLMAHGADPDDRAVYISPLSPDSDDCSSAMCAAAEFGRLPVLRYFLTHGASVTPDCVAYAAAAGHLAAAALLAKNISSKDMENAADAWKSPLAYAVASGNIATLRWLLGRFYLHSPLRNTALLWAALYGRADMAQLLLARGADPNYSTCLEGLWAPGQSQPQTCYWWNEPLIAASAGDASPAVVRELLAHGARVNQVTPDLQFSPLSEAVGYGRPRIAALLLAAGAEVNHADHYGDTPLIDAVQYGTDAAAHNLRVIQLLVEHGASVNVHNAQGKSALSFAKSPAVIAYLRAHGAQ